jgi:hypothetical protein
MRLKDFSILVFLFSNCFEESIIILDSFFFGHIRITIEDIRKKEKTKSHHF